MKKYNIINNTLGWIVFAVAAATYLLTLEPTASFWDCPEFILQGYKLEIGHPPGNPVYILAARIMANFAGGDVALVSKCVNAMSAILSALTILLLFWSVTHLAKRLVVKDGEEDKMNFGQYLAVMGSGLCGALVYTWSDTFWFSAVEAEVYAFSSFCTALVFWLILKWEARADNPSSDRYLILIAFVFGISLGVHLLNLLAIPAIALIFYYRRWQGRTNAVGSLIALGVSFVLIVLILYGLEPGFVELSGYFELMAVNSFGMHYLSGVIIYAVLLMGVLAWNIWEIYSNNSQGRIIVSFCAAIILSGMLFIGDGLVLPVLLIIGLIVAAIMLRKKNISRRILANISLSIMMIFIGFCSYALVLIRSNANTPVDENSPNSPFALTSYLSRDQYGKSPLLYGNTAWSELVYDESGSPIIKDGPTKYTRSVKKNEKAPDHYTDLGPSEEYINTPELNMLFPRIHSSAHRQQYIELLGEGDEFETEEGTLMMSDDGDVLRTESMPKPSQGQNISFFVSYQLNYMYFRYFFWNFVGRQNDLQGNGPGDAMRGNWISGIPFIDNTRLGDQDMLPEEFTTENKGHNVFFMLPLILGIIGLIWQACKGKRGIEQFWVIFFLFFMTGIAIVLYLNQTPNQPRERDYAYAGSFYAFSIWVGLGVAALWNMRRNWITGIIGSAVGLLVPLQMVSQTWDDHDRSGRYFARDFGMNYLSSVDKNAILFCNGDNDTFPLWYAQEVEGYRTDVRAVNLSYLSTDWYIAQMQRAAYDSKPVPMHADKMTYAYDKRQAGYIATQDTTATPLADVLKNFYDDSKFKNNEFGRPVFNHNLVSFKTNAAQAIKNGAVPKAFTDSVDESITIDLSQGGNKGGLSASETASLDMILSSIENGWERPCYFASTVPSSYHVGLSPWLLCTGMAYQVTPVKRNSDPRDIRSNTDKMYEIVTKKFRWGGLDKTKPGTLYIDETIGRMISSTRNVLITLADDLIQEKKYDKAEVILDLMMKKMPIEDCALNYYDGYQIALAYHDIAEQGGRKAADEKAVKLLEHEIKRYAKFKRYVDYCSENGFYSDELAKVVSEDVLPQLLMLYREIKPDNYTQLVESLAKLGVKSDVRAQYLQLKRPTQEEIEEYERAKAAAYEDRQKMLEQLRADSQARADQQQNQQAPAGMLNFGQ